MFFFFFFFDGFSMFFFLMVFFGFSVVLFMDFCVFSMDSLCCVLGGLHKVCVLLRWFCCAVWVVLRR